MIEIPTTTNATTAMDATTSVPFPPLQFLHIPKTGGTAVEEAAALADIPWGYCRWPKRKGRDRLCRGLRKADPDFKIRMPVWHVPRQFLQDVTNTSIVDDPYGTAPMFVIVRNPFERAVSEYYYMRGRLLKKTKGLNNPKLLNSWIRREVGISFRKSSYLRAGGHWIPQYDYVYYHPEGNKQVKHVMVQHVLKFENLEQDFRDLMSQYNLNVTLPSKGKRGLKGRSSIAQLTARNLTKSTCRLLRKRYWNDFKAFAYDLSDCGSKQAYKTKK
jgi:hypothetical protein